MNKIDGWREGEREGVREGERNGGKRIEGWKEEGDGWMKGIKR